MHCGYRHRKGRHGNVEAFVLDDDRSTIIAVSTKTSKTEAGAHKIGAALLKKTEKARNEAAEPPQG